MIPYPEVLLGHRVASGAEGFANHFVGVKVNLPVVIGVAVGTHGEHGAIEIELQDFDVRRRVRNRVGNFADPFFEQLDRFVVIDRVRQFALRSTRR